MKLRILALLVCLSVSAHFAAAQTLGKIQGTVKDATGAVVPGAKISLNHVATANKFSTTANEVGYYQFPAAQSGRWAIAIEAPGMDTFKGEFLLQTGEVAVVDATLSVGAAPPRSPSPATSPPW